MTKTRKIGIMISKGGSGKTTTAIHLAWGLAERGKKVLVIDTDSQGHVSRFLKCDTFFGLADLGKDFLSTKPNNQKLQFEDTVFKVREGFDLLSGDGNIGEYERLVQTQSAGIEYQLGDLMEGHDDIYDFVIVDTAPGFAGLNKNVYQYVDEIIIPVRLEFSALISVTDFFDSFANYRIQKLRRSKLDLTLSYILPTFFDKRLNETKLSLEYLTEFVQAHAPDAKIMESIPKSSKISTAVGYGKTVFDYDKKGRASESYNKFVDEIINGKEMEKKANA